MITKEMIDAKVHSYFDLWMDPLHLDEILPKYRRQYLKWYPDNMAIIQQFERISYFLKENGKREIYGAAAVWEHIRWNTLLASKSDEYKLPAFACPPTSRVVMALNPNLDGMFLTAVTNKSHPRHRKNLKEID